MRRSATGLALAVSLLGCNGAATTPAPTRGAQVAILTDEAGFTSFVNIVIDVVADPETGTPVLESRGLPMRWPNGFTAWRVGSETEVLDPDGNRVIVTGNRYRFYPGYSPAPYLVIGYVEPCPPDVFGTTCVLGPHQQGDY